MIVAGECGAGKSTFLDTLFHSQMFSHLEDDPESENSQIRIRSTTFSEEEVSMKVTVIETIKFGGRIKNKLCWYPLCSIIDRMNFLRVFQQEQPHRRGKELQDLIHVCIFFITPSTNGLSEIDIQAMQELGSRVNLIPVISKADSYTSEEIFEYKKMIRQGCEENSIKVYSPATEFPYTLVGASNEGGMILRGRRHNQGIVQVDNEAHCDFVKLKRLLIDELPDLSENAEGCFEAYRTQLLNKRLQLARLDYPVGGDDNALILTVEMENMERAEYWTNPFFTETCRLLNRRFDELLKSVDTIAEKRVHEKMRQEIEKLYRKTEELKLRKMRFS